MDRPDETKEESRNNFILKLSFLLQLLAFILSFIAFFSPFWYIELNSRIRAGLWGRCDDIELNCIWFIENNYAWERSLPGWHVAAQVMFAIGITILFISCAMAIGNIMFKCCKLHLDLGTCPIVFGILIAVAMIFQTFSIGIFGIGAYQVYECSINSWVANFEWAFYVGIASLFNCLIASLGYIYSGYAIRQDMKGYMTDVYTQALQLMLTPSNRCMTSGRITKKQAQNDLSGPMDPQRLDVSEGPFQEGQAPNSTTVHDQFFIWYCNHRTTNIPKEQE